MNLKEKITQVIVDLNNESIKYPRMKTNDVTFMLSKLINDYKENVHNGWIKIESENDFPKNDLDCHFIFKRQGTRYQSFGVYDFRLKSFWSGSLKLSNVTHYQEIVKPIAPTT